MRTVFYNPNSRFANRELKTEIFQTGIWNMAVITTVFTDLNIWLIKRYRKAWEKVILEFKPSAFFLKNPIC